MFFHCPDCAKNDPMHCASHPRITCPDCGLVYTDHSDWSGPSHSDADYCRGKSMAPLCTGYEVVCPDGCVRHYPFHNEGDAESTARLASERRCRLWPKPSPLELSQPPCPEGHHVVRPMVFLEAVEDVGQA